MMRLMLVLSLVFLPVLALAQLPEAGSDAFLNALLDAIAKGDWRYVAVLAVIGLTYLVRRYGPSLPRVGPFLATSRGGAIVALVFALVVGLAPPFLGWVSWTPRIVLDVLLNGFASIGGWVGVRRIVGVSAEKSPANVVPLPAPPA
jgi:hypothetical protein